MISVTLSSTLSTRSPELINSTERLKGRSPVQRVVTYKEKKVCTTIVVC